LKDLKSDTRFKLYWVHRQYKNSKITFTS